MKIVASLIFAFAILVLFPLFAGASQGDIASIYNGGTGPPMVSTRASPISRRRTVRCRSVR